MVFFVLLLLGTFLAWHNTSSEQAQAASGAMRSAITAVAYVRSSGGQGGDIVLWDARTGAQKPLTHNARFSNLAATQGKIVCLRPADGSLYLLSTPDWRPHRLPVGKGYSGTPCWLPGKNRFLVGRARQDGIDGDGGLWLVDLNHQSARRLLPDYDSDFPVSNGLLLSPGHDRIASLGGGVDGLILRVLDLKTSHPMHGLTGREITSGGDAAWLDENNLLVACSSQTAEGERTQGGLRLLNVRTHQLSHWLYSPASDVTQIVRSNRGDQFAVTLNTPNRVELIDAKTKTRRSLPFTQPTTLAGLSDDDQNLLVTISHSQGAQVGDAYIFDTKTGQKQLVASNVLEDVWFTP